jgi:transposase-like protein
MSKLKNPHGLFVGRHFDRDVIILCVRWYLLTNSACAISSR